MLNYYIKAIGSWKLIIIFSVIWICSFKNKIKKENKMGIKSKHYFLIVSYKEYFNQVFFSEFYSDAW